MKRLIQLSMLMALLLTAGAGWAFDPPTIIGELQGAPDSANFGAAFCWAGDQNGDGYDDLLVVHDPHRVEGHVNAVKLYWGGERTNNSPDFIFRHDNSEAFGTEGLMSYGGKLSSDNANWIMIGSLVYEGRRLIGSKLYFYRGGDALDTIPDFVMQRPPQQMLTVRSYGNAPPSDFNGDGFNDLVAAEYEDVDARPAEVKILFGGAEFDTLFDWTTNINDLKWSMLSAQWTTGGDVNNDGYDDFILMLNGNNWIYLGGDPMDTVAVLETRFEDYEPRVLKNLTLLPDVNDDGYDDWGCYWHESRGPNEFDGYYLFYGGEELDFVPDVELEGNNHPFGTDGVISGGNFNGDRFGDVIAVNSSGNFEDGEIHVYFGREQIRNAPSLLVFTERTYGDYYSGLGTAIGAIGDYNGDGISDLIAAKGQGDFSYRRLIVMTSAENWVLSVLKEDNFLSPIWDFHVNPNPFNQYLDIKIQTDLLSEFSLSIHDLAGRSVLNQHVTVNSISNVHANTGQLGSGLYIVRCVNLSNNHTILKKAVLLR